MHCACTLHSQRVACCDGGYHSQKDLMTDTDLVGNLLQMTGCPIVRCVCDRLFIGKGVCSG